MTSLKQNSSSKNIPTSSQFSSQLYQQLVLCTYFNIWGRRNGTCISSPPLLEACIHMLPLRRENVIGNVWQISHLVPKSSLFFLHSPPSISSRLISSSPPAQRAAIRKSLQYTGHYIITMVIKKLTSRFAVKKQFNFKDQIMILITFPL